MIETTQISTQAFLTIAEQIQSISILHKIFLREHKEAKCYLREIKNPYITKYIIITCNKRIRRLQGEVYKAVAGKMKIRNKYLEKKKLESNLPF